MTTREQVAIWRRVASDGAMGPQAAGFAVPAMADMLDRAEAIIDCADGIVDMLVAMNVAEPRDGYDANECKTWLADWRRTRVPVDNSPEIRTPEL